VIYLDHAATTPLSPAAERAWLAAQRRLRDTPGNPSALHAGGRVAARIVEDARVQIAGALGADRAEVLFTSGATESNALGVIGGARGAATPDQKTVLISSVEHDSVGNLGEAAPDLDWRLMPVSRDGVTVIEPVGPEVALASLALVCAETGIIQPVSDLVEAAGKTLVHTDAAQAVGHMPINFHDLGVDLMTIGGHKIGAPVGTGALFVRRGVKITTDRPGGGQERKYRSGTVDAAGAAALAAAVVETTENLQREVTHQMVLREHLMAGLPEEVRLTSPAKTSPGIVHLSLPTSHPEVLLLSMDQAGIMVSAGSACHSGVTRPSQILLSMGRSEQEALGVLRVSFGRENTVEDVDFFLRALPAALEAAGRMDERDARKGKQAQ